MGIPADCAGTITIAEFDQDRRGWRTALQHAPTDHNSSINQLYYHLNHQLGDCRANAPQPAPPGAALTENTDTGRPLPFRSGLGASRCRTCSRRGRLCRYVADLACSHGGREDRGL